MTEQRKERFEAIEAMELQDEGIDAPIVRAMDVYAAEIYAEWKYGSSEETLRPVLLTGSSSIYRALLDLTLPGKHAWCKRHGVELMLLQGEGSYAWTYGRLAGVDRLLALGHPAVAWYGADVAIRSLDHSWQQLLDEHDFAIAEDCCGLNSDVFWARNTPKTRRFFHALLYEGHRRWPETQDGLDPAENERRWGSEQYAMEHYLGTEAYRGWARIYIDDEARVLQSWLEGWSYPGNPAPVALYREGDHALHLTGGKFLGDKIALFERILTPLT